MWTWRLGEYIKGFAKVDVHILNKRELNQEERDKQYRLCQQLGINTEDLEEDRAVAQVVAVGEGQCRLSWIWFTGNGIMESMEDPLTYQGKFI